MFLLLLYYYSNINIYWHTINVSVYVHILACVQLQIKKISGQISNKAACLLPEKNCYLFKMRNKLQYTCHICGYGLHFRLAYIYIYTYLAICLLFSYCSLKV